MAQKTDTLTLNKSKAFAADLSKQVHPLCITAKQRAKIIVYLENGTCRKLMPHHQDPVIGTFIMKELKPHLDIYIKII